MEIISSDPLIESRKMWTNSKNDIYYNDRSTKYFQFNIQCYVPYAYVVGNDYPPFIARNTINKPIRLGINDNEYSIIFHDKHQDKCASVTKLEWTINNRDLKLIIFI